MYVMPCKIHSQAMPVAQQCRQVQGTAIRCNLRVHVMAHLVVQHSLSASDDEATLEVPTID